MKIVLLGKIPKGDKQRESFTPWYETYEAILKKYISDPQILHGDLIRDKEGSMKVVGHDLWLIKHADVVIVDAREKIGAGTAQEMVMAKYFRKLLVAVLPKNTHHRRTDVIFDGVTIHDWIHPFLDVSSDHIVGSIEEAASWISATNLHAVHVKGIEVFDEAIAQFETDMPEIVREYAARGF